jgi:DNA primase
LFARGALMELTEFQRQAKAFFSMSEPISELIGEYVPLKKVDGVTRACCPFHDDGGDCLIVMSSDTFECKICHAKGDIVDFVMLYEEVGIDEALRMMGERGGAASREVVVGLKAQYPVSSN